MVRGFFISLVERKEKWQPRTEAYKVRGKWLVTETSSEFERDVYISRVD